MNNTTSTERVKHIVLTDPHPALRIECAPIEPHNGIIAYKIFELMGKYIEYYDALGLAANQIGILYRLISIKHNDRILHMANPEIMSADNPLESPEACLSCPGKVVVKERDQDITVHYLDKWLVPQTIYLHGTDAVAVQHEIDHLDGKLIIDD